MIIQYLPFPLISSNSVVAAPSFSIFGKPFGNVFEVLCDPSPTLDYQAHSAFEVVFLPAEAQWDSFCKIGIRVSDCKLEFKQNTYEIVYKKIERED